MPLRTSYAPGVPCWVDLASPDTDAAAEFYAGLFGWQAKVDPGATGGSRSTFTLHGHIVGGLASLDGADATAAWNVSIDVADAEATIARVIAHGGEPVVEPMRVLDDGYLATVRDPAGSTISLWQPLGRHGSELVNEAGAFSWNELATTDLTHAIRFYCDVFGWTVPDERDSAHVVFSLDGQSVCGAHEALPQEPSGWVVWFGTSDCDTAAKAVSELGGTVVDGPTPMGSGRGATVADPHGARFGIASFG